MNTATVTYLRGVRFNNPALPKIWPFSMDSYIGEGLRFAVQPQHNPASLLDLSGNGTVFSLDGGGFEFTPLGVKLNGGALGRIVTNAQETADFSTVIVYRLHKIAAWAGLAMAFSTYRTGVYEPGLDGTIRGSSVGYMELSAAAGSVAPNPRIQSVYLDDSNPSDLKVGNYQLSNAPNLPSFSDSLGVSPWFYQVTVMDGVQGFFSGQARTMNGVSDFGNVSPQKFGIRPIPVPAYWGLGGSPYSASFAGFYTEVACAALWDRPLGGSERVMQYEMVREWCLDRGIMI